MPVARHLACLMLLLMPASALAWGETGHRLVCQLAFDSLSTPAKGFVTDTLAQGELLDGNGSTDFAEACLWADKARYEDYKWTYEQHFINVPRAAKRIEFGRDCAAMDCIAVGIQRSLTYLSRPAEGKRDKARNAAALRFLGHYLGDLHQPLHVSHGEDLGGNLIVVKWFDEDTNLHAVWDRKIMERANITYPGSLEMLKSVKTEFASRNVLEWMQGSLILARSHAYPGISGKPVKVGERLEEAYFERSKPIVIEQLATAGRRLAYLLERLTAGSLDTNILIE